MKERGELVKFLFSLPYKLNVPFICYLQDKPPMYNVDPR